MNVNARMRIENNLKESEIDLSSHLSVHIQIALDLDRSQIDLTHWCELRLSLSANGRNSIECI